ncbi:MAG: archease [Anaerolineaceae bacterium]|jgi:SHS2 domain-containing protein|nr:archease [Anaerolineaceae bacterium]
MSTFRKNHGFKEIPHKADAAIIVYGFSLPDLFINAAQGMYHIMGIVVEDHDYVEDTIALQASDHESLLVSYLTELLFLAENNLKIEIIELKIEDFLLNMKILKASAAKIDKEIKAVTFNEMKIIKKNGIYQAKVVFDL